MKCPHCEKEVKFECDLYSDIPGAVFVVNDDSEGICTYPAVLGLRKYEGCVEFGISEFEEPLCDISDLNFMQLSKNECTNIYGDSPPHSTGWLVKPGKKAGEYEWTQVDQDIVFSN